MWTHELNFIKENKKSIVFTSIVYFKFQIYLQQAGNRGTVSDIAQLWFQYHLLKKAQKCCTQKVYQHKIRHFLAVELHAGIISIPLQFPHNQDRRISIIHFTPTVIKKHCERANLSSLNRTLLNFLLNKKQGERQ